MGHALLTQLLLPTLLRTATPSTSPPRVVVVASHGHVNAPRGGLQLAGCTSPQAELSFLSRYGQSKLANILFARSLATRYPQLLSCSVHPGAVMTPVTRGFQQAHPWLTQVLLPPVSLFLTSVQKGARNQLWACTAAGPESGEFYDPVAKPGETSKEADSDRLADELWAWTTTELAKGGAPGWPDPS